MLALPARFAWMTSGLYWRTFFLLAFLIAISMAAWVVSSDSRKKVRQNRPLRTHPMRLPRGGESDASTSAAVLQG